MTSAGFSITRDGTPRIGSDSDQLDGNVAGMVDVFHHRRWRRPLLVRTGDGSPMSAPIPRFRREAHTCS